MGGRDSQSEAGTFKTGTPKDRPLRNEMVASRNVIFLTPNKYLKLFKLINCLKYVFKNYKE